MLVIHFELSRSLPLAAAIAVSVLGATAVAGLYAFVAGWFNSRPKVNPRRMNIHIYVFMYVYAFTYKYMYVCGSPCPP